MDRCFPAFPPLVYPERPNIACPLASSCKSDCCSGSFKKKFKAGAWPRSVRSSTQHWYAPHRSPCTVLSPTYCSYDNAHKVQQNRQHSNSTSHMMHPLNKKPNIPPTILTQLTALGMLFRVPRHTLGDSLHWVRGTSLFLWVKPRPQQKDVMSLVPQGVNGEGAKHTSQSPLPDVYKYPLCTCHCRPIFSSSTCHEQSCPFYCTLSLLKLIHIHSAASGWTDLWDT